MTGLEMLLVGKKITKQENHEDYWCMINNTIYYYSNCGSSYKSNQNVNYFLQEKFVEYDEFILLSNADKNKCYINDNYMYSYCPGFGYWIQCSYGHYCRVIDPNCIYVKRNTQ